MTTQSDPNVQSIYCIIFGTAPICLAGPLRVLSLPFSSPRLDPVLSLYLYLQYFEYETDLQLDILTNI